MFIYQRVKKFFVTFCYLRHLTDENNSICDDNLLGKLR